MFPIALRIVKVVAGFLLSLLCLGWIVEHTGLSHGTAIVHVTEPDVEVRVGDQVFQFENRPYDPIVCELPAGQHELVMTRRGRVLYRETFTIRRGLNMVLTAWDPNRDQDGRHFSRTR